MCVNVCELKLPVPRVSHRHEGMDLRGKGGGGCGVGESVTTEYFYVHTSCVRFAVTRFVWSSALELPSKRPAFHERIVSVQTSTLLPSCIGLHS